MSIYRPPPSCNVDLHRRRSALASDLYKLSCSPDHQYNSSVAHEIANEILMLSWSLPQEDYLTHVDNVVWHSHECKTTW
jgi:hypothetical protein